MTQINRPNSKGGINRTYALKHYCPDCGKECAISLRGAYSELWYVCHACETEERGTVWDEVSADIMEVKWQRAKKNAKQKRGY